MSVAIGVMARAPVPGRCKTRLAARLGPARAAALYEALLVDSLRAFGMLRARRRVVMAAPEDGGFAALRALAPPEWEVIEQVGENLGTRLEHAMGTLGAEGAAILVDRDSQTLPIR